MTQEEKKILMTTAPVEKLVCKMAVPTIISMLISSFYNMADTYFVGTLNTQATAAVGIAFALMSVIQALGFMFGHGTGVLIANVLGKGDTKEAQKISVTGFVYAFVIGSILTVLGLLFLEPLCYILGSTDTILPYAKDYIRIILIGAPIMMASLVMNNQMRYQGNAVYAMVGIVTGAVINIALDPLLINVFDMGIAGAAWATIISQSISFVLLIIGSCREGNIHINLKKFDYHPRTIGRIVKGGLPSLFRQGLASIAAASMNLAAKPFGDAVIAGMTVSGRIMMFINSTLIGFGQGFQPVCGFNYGAGKYDRVKKAFYFCVKTSFVFLIVLSILTALGAPFLVELFRKGDSEVIKVGAMALRFNCITLPLNAWIVLTNMLLQATGKSVSAIIASASRQGFFYLPAIWILSYYYGVTGIEVTQAVADVFALILSIPLALHFFKKIAKIS